MKYRNGEYTTVRRPLPTYGRRRILRTVYLHSEPCLHSLAKQTVGTTFSPRSQDKLDSYSISNAPAVRSSCDITLRHEAASDHNHNHIHIHNQRTMSSILCMTYHTIPAINSSIHTTVQCIALHYSIRQCIGYTGYRKQNQRLQRRY